MPSSLPAVQLYSLRDQLDHDVDGVLHELAQIGVRDVEPYDVSAWAVRLRGPLVEHGMRATSAHGSVVDDPDATLTAAAELGVTTIYEPFQPQERFASLDTLRALADDLCAAADRAADHGIGFGYHNHWWELETLVDGAPALLVLADLVGAQVSFEVDVYWAAVGGSNPVALLTALGDQVTALHIKDGPVSRDTSVQVPAGQGRLPMPAILEAAPKARRIAEFDAYEGDLVAALGHSLTYLGAY